jgi:hypothetical protein
MNTNLVPHQKTRTYSLVVVLILIAALLFGGCTSTAGSSVVPPQPTLAAHAINSSSVDRVEVFHFHRNQQCESCIAVGNLAEATVNANFKEELASGRLVFTHINAELPENAALAEKYGVTGSSLWIGVYDKNGFQKQQDLTVWSLINNKDQYETYLSGIISKRLNGDLS